LPRSQRCTTPGCRHASGGSGFLCDVEKVGISTNYREIALTPYRYGCSILYVTCCTRDMYLKRSRVIAEAIILAFVGVLLPLSAAIYAAWALSVNTEKGRLELVASQAAARTHLSILNTAAMLR